MSFESKTTTDEPEREKVLITNLRSQNSYRANGPPFHVHDPICTEAADEIERLQSLLHAAEKRAEDVEAETIERCARLAEIPPTADFILCGDTCDYIGQLIRTALKDAGKMTP